MSQFNSHNKNPPWARQVNQHQLPSNSSNNCQMQQRTQMPPQLMGQLGNANAGISSIVSNSALLQYPNTQVFQTNQIAQIPQSQVFSQQMGTVSYPTRQQLNTAAFSSSATMVNVGGISRNNQVNEINSSPNSGPKQRVFTGRVTEVKDDFGFVDEEVFFPASSVVKGSNPSVGDRVLVEAVFNPALTFKWNATRIQVLPIRRNERNNSSDRNNRSFSNYNAVPPPLIDNSRNNNDIPSRRKRRDDERSRHDDDDTEIERKKRRDERREREEKEKEREKERPKSPLVRKRSKSPKKRQTRVLPRYTVRIPKIALDMPEADVMEIKRRYNNLYIPSDFFVSSFRWVDVFPPHRNLTLERPCNFYIMHKDVDPVEQINDIYDPPDADYLFSAKVMLLGMIEMNEMYKRCCSLAEDTDREGSIDFVHPTRVINFLVGLRGKNETMAIGGPWSPSLDGPNPDKDPKVLIKTAIRNCKALTGIDLSNCTQWFRFLEVYYRRSETVHKGKTIPARVETVVLFLPDVWNCLPTHMEWDNLQASYKKLLNSKLNVDQEPADDPDATDEKDIDNGKVTKKEPSHYSQLDPKNMVVSALREELEARSMLTKGLKSQLIARLTKVLKTEQDKESEESEKIEEATAVASNISSETTKNKTPVNEKDDKNSEKKKDDDEKKKDDDREKTLLKRRYTLPDTPHLLVHPSRTAKSGKFNCTVMSLSLLLDYRQDDSKEHTFEVSLFAELFNEMLMRDFGFRIYRALVESPEKPKEEKDDKDKKEKKSDNKDEKKADNKEEKKDKKEKDRKSTEGDEEEDDCDDDEDKKDRKDKDKKDNSKRKRIKMITEDPFLLLSFVYFDQTHCGYIIDKDVEELIFTLGLNLSRSQVKRLVQKVITRDSLHYRKLTDKPKDDKEKDTSLAKLNGENNEVLTALGLGNKILLPVFSAEANSSPATRSRKDGGEGKTLNTNSESSNSGMVMFNGSLIDLEKLTLQLKRSDAARLETEKLLTKARQDYSAVKEQNSKLNLSIKDLNGELKHFKERLTNTNTELSSAEVKRKFYFTLLSEIHDKVSPVVSSKSDETEEVSEKNKHKDQYRNDKKDGKLKSDTDVNKYNETPGKKIKQEKLITDEVHSKQIKVEVDGKQEENTKSADVEQENMDAND